MSSGKYDVIILDEVNVAVRLGLLDVKEVLALIAEKPENVHLILSGRNAHEEVIRVAHLVSEVRSVKHPYDQGIEAEKGIDSTEESAGAGASAPARSSSGVPYSSPK